MKRKKELQSARIIELLGPDLLDRLAEIHSALGGTLYLTGGTVRDMILGRNPADIDLTVREDARQWASELARRTGGTYVALGRDEDAARVVWRGRDVDFASYREGAATIDEELTKRDITVNSMAVSLDTLLAPGGVRTDSQALAIIDPAGGLEDMEKNEVRNTSGLSFKSDPLRLLRVFRFAAVLGYTIDRKSFELISRQKEWIVKAAPERISHELDLIMRTGRAHETFTSMAGAGLLFEILPELKYGIGMEQPSSHHLDVFDHCLATLGCMENIQQDPAVYFPKRQGVMKQYLAAVKNRTRLKWAALFHDLGKPPTLAINEDKGGRITFYNHDREGVRLVGAIASRLRWSSENKQAVEKLVGLHMRPFFLGNDMRQGKLTLKACLRLVRLAGTALPGLFLLSMADALAGKGENRPEKIELEVAELFGRLEKVQREHVDPVRSQPPLVTGKDLIGELNLAPGPIFKDILEFLEEAHMERTVTNRQEALTLVREYLERYREEKSDSDAQKQ